jgi:hypothetical protein
VVYHDNVIVAHHDILNTGLDLCIPTITKVVLREGLAAVHPDVIFFCREADDVKPTGTQRTSIHRTIAVAG